MREYISTNEKKDRDDWYADLGRIRGNEMTYDVFRCSNGEMVMSGVYAEGAAKFARTSVNFVIMTAKRPANNKYGRLATETGYYFKQHYEKKNTKTAFNKNNNYAVYRLKEDLFFKLVKRNYSSLRDFRLINDIKPPAIDKHLRGVHVFPSSSDTAMKICKALDVDWTELYERVK